MKETIILILLTITLASYGMATNPFLKLKFDKVVMYDYEGRKGSDLHIVENGKLAKSIKKQVQLDKATIENLNMKLGKTNSYGGGTAACFEPHLGFVYYYDNKIVAYVTICLDCNRLYSSIDIPNQKQGKVAKGGKAYYLNDGLSKTFRQYINQLLVKNNFSHQTKKQ